MKLFDGGIEEIVLESLLGAREISTEELIGRVGRRREGATKQGVYRVLRKLKRDGKIVVYKSLVSINTLWIEKLRLMTSGLSGSSIFGDLSSLKKEEKVVIEGRGLAETDALWSEAFVNIENKLSAKHPLYLYNPHNWTILAQPEIDRIHIDRLRHKQRLIFLSIGGRTSLDRETVRLASQENIRCSLSSLFRSPHFVAIIGDYVLSVKLSQKGSASLDKIFREYSSSEEAAREIKMINRKIKSKILIENDPIKAKNLKKKIARDFFVPRQNNDF
jgi:DNA-binding PadR family transcriptional regulator